jgi:GDPmannose 4,6-dehydratase
MFGRAAAPQNESTPFLAISPYAASKLFAHCMTLAFRESYGMHASTAILFNHESPRRGETFVTRKITRALANILAGRQQTLYLGDLTARRDWGYAPEYVDAMWRIVQGREPGDYVIATGEGHSVREFLDHCCARVGLDADTIVKTDDRYRRPTEIPVLVGDPSRAARELDWVATTRFAGVADVMLAADLAAVGIEPETYGLAPSPCRAIILGMPA